MNRTQSDSYWYDIGYKTARKKVIDQVLEIIDSQKSYFKGDEDGTTWIDKRATVAAVQALQEGGEGWESVMKSTFAAM